MPSSLAALRPALPILIGASVMLTLSMGLRQSFGLFMQPMTRDISISVSDFTLALAVQNLGPAYVDYDPLFRFQRQGFLTLRVRY